MLVGGETKAAKAERACRLIDESIARRRLPTKVLCAVCREPVGSYYPGVVRVKSVERPRVFMKCVRAGCKATTDATLDETIE